MKKKLRGQSRRFNNAVYSLHTSTHELKSAFREDFYYINLPLGKGIINPYYARSHIKKSYICELIKRSQYLSVIKNSETENYRILLVLNFPCLWDSRIYIFKNSSALKRFIAAKQDWGNWTALSDDSYIREMFRKDIPENFQTAAFVRNTSNCIDSNGTTWILGELN